MNICIFPGTFNPIHIAHVNMATFALKEFKFDKVIFIPAHIPPQKQLDSELARHRYNMVKLVTDRNPHFEISDIEYQSNEKSYTYITVKKIREMYNIQGRLNLIIGTDAFLNTKSWYKIEELKNLVHFIVFPRGNDIVKETEFEGYSFTIVDTDKNNLSSTELRKNYKNKTEKKVEEYIIQNGLYN